MVSTPMAPKPTKKTQPKTNKRRSSLRRAVARPRKPVAPSGKRKQAGEALRENEELLAKAFRTSPHPIGITELATGRCIEVNEACLQLFGFRREEVIGNTTLSLGIWPKQEDRARLVDRLKSGEPVRDLELNFRTSSGELRHILVSADLVELGGTPCLLTAGNDITGRKRAEEASRVSEERFRTMAEAVPSFLFETDAAGWNIWTSAGWCRFTGQTPEQVAGHGWADALHPDDRAANLDQWLHCMEQGVPFEAKQRLRRVDGGYAWVIARALPVRDGHGTVSRWVGSVTDVDDIVQAEEALRESEQRFRAIYDQTYEFIGLLTPDGILIDVNHTALAFRGLQRSDVIGKPFWETPWWDISQELREKVRTAIAKAATGEFVRLRAQHRAQDGAIEEIDFSMTPIMDQSGKVIQIIPEGRRITALAKVQDELRQAKAELECRVQERTRELEQANAALLQQQEELRRQQQRLQDLTGKLLVAQESERRRIAQELHDDVTQRLAALTIDLRSLRLQGSPVIELNQLHDRAKQLTTDVQRMSHQLHPSALDHLGLEEAVHDHVEEFAVRTGLAAQVVVRGLPPTIPVTQATCLYRVLQESLQNVQKHANATSVLIRLLTTAGGVGLRVHDDGRGFEDAPETARRNGLGLTSMAERVGVLQGTFRVKTKPGDGTEVHAWVPLALGDTRGEPQ